MFLNQLFKIPNTRADRRAELDTQLSTVQTDDERQQVKEQWMISETEKNKKRREKISIKDFEIVQTLGHGGFGVVRLVRDKVTQEVFAMKALRKADMLKRGQEAHVRAERDLLSQASQVADWIVQLNCTFQDNENLYFVLEYMPGGDLLGLLIKLDIFPEDFAKHYCAEMVLAIEEVHKLGMIHRDVKPDNFLFNSEGHIKLADFGLATDFHWAHSTEYDYQLKRQATRDAPTPKDRKGTAFSIVGTANYIAPEVLIGGGYDKTCDWWSLGVILFECVFGYPPFCAKTQQQTRNKILNWKKTFQFPSEPEASYDCKDLIRKLICGADERLGNRKLDFPELTEEETKDMTKVMIKRMLAEGDASDIKKHPWFADIDWNNLHQKRPPFVPDPKRFYFDEVDEKEVERMHQEAATEFGPEDTSNMDERKRTAFMGFSYQSPQGMMPK
ncbi:kinase-like domain-containing protein [Gorgonomyces haynaldii]|nr:kinase-like domain-containing protein [Gorgonomyces haynaldii]